MNIIDMNMNMNLKLKDVNHDNKIMGTSLWLISLSRDVIIIIITSIIACA